MAGQPVLPKGSPPPLAPYSPGFRSGQLVCTAGMLAMDASGNLVGEGDAGAQTRQVMENIKEIQAARKPCTKFRFTILSTVEAWRRLAIGKTSLPRLRERSLPRHRDAVHTAPQERRSFENRATMAPSMPFNCASRGHAPSRHD